MSLKSSESVFPHMEPNGIAQFGSHYIVKVILKSFLSEFSSFCPFPSESFQGSGNGLIYATTVLSPQLSLSHADQV